MLRRVITAFEDPREFFRWLDTQPARLVPPFLVLVIGAVISLAAITQAFRHSSGPQTQELLRLLGEAGVSPTALAWGYVVSTPLFALLGWVLVWVPIRLGAGPAKRLWEVAGWSQLPQWVASPVRAVTIALAGLDPFLAATIDVVTLLWCTWFVRAGVLEVSHARANRAAGVYFACGIATVAFNLLMGILMQSQGSQLLAP